MRHGSFHPYSWPGISDFHPSNNPGNPQTQSEPGLFVDFSGEKRKDALKGS
jgi:hypothetical protein